MTVRLFCVIGALLAFSGTAGLRIAVHAAPASTNSLRANGVVRYTGTRERTFGGSGNDPNVKAYDDRYTVVENETVKDSGAMLQREDDFDFEPVGVPLESPAPEVAQRIRSERVVREGTRTTVFVTKQITTTDHQTTVPTFLAFGASQDETTTTTYAKPQIVAIFGGPPGRFFNDIARKEGIESTDSRKTREVLADGSISEERNAGPTRQTYAQAPNGDAKYDSFAVGFYSYDLAIDPPTVANAGRTVHVVRTTSGRAVGPNPIVTTTFDVPDWYPGGELGAESDVVRSIGNVVLPADCLRPLGASRAYATREERTSTLATGDVSNETLRTFTIGETIVCTIDEKRARAYDPTTGLVISSSSDVLILRLAAGPVAAPSLVLVAPHVMPLHRGVDRHVTGAPALVLETGRSGYVGLRLVPSGIDDADASVAVAPAIADARFEPGGLVLVRAGPAPGRTTLSVTLRGAAQVTASIPIFVYRSIAIGCEGDHMRSATFAADGSVVRSKEAAQADVYVECEDERSTRALHFPLGATVLRFANDDAAPFTTVRADRWQAEVTVLDDASKFADAVRTPNSASDDSQNILLVKTHTGEIVKIHSDGRAAYAVVGAYAISIGGAFAF